MTINTVKGKRQEVQKKHGDLKQKLKQTKKDESDGEDDSFVSTESDETDDDEYYETVSDSNEDSDDSSEESVEEKKVRRIHKREDEEDESPKKQKDKMKKGEDKTKEKKKDKKKLVCEEEDSEEDEDYDTEDEPPKKQKDKKMKKGEDKTKEKKKDKKNLVYEEEDYDSEEDEDYDTEDAEKDERQLLLGGGDRNGGIILSFDGFGGGEEMNNDEADYEQMMKEDKHEQCDSDDEKMFMKESYIPIAITQTKPKNQKPKKTVSAKNISMPVETKYAELSQLKKELGDQLQKNPNSKILQNAIQECRKSIAELVRIERHKNAKTYYKLVHKDEKDKKNTNELSYFKKKLSNQEQIRVMKDLKEINSLSNTDKPYRLALLESNIPAKFKAVTLQKLNVLKSMDPSDSEYYKMKNWVDGFMRVPFGKYNNLNVKLSDGIDASHKFICDAKTTLDNCAYGLNDAKLQILQMVGQWISNPSAMGTAIAIKGPPGTGKTTLVKDGISKILGREFAFIALGGTGDASFLEGHSYTYEGSSWGKIVSILMESKCMNPVIFFDELDKISDTPRGEEIASILTHLTDTTQNNQFHDKYFSEVDFDLSKCLFIFSYNDESKVNPILRDRMYRIQTKGYDAKDKIIIARNHLLPKIREQVNFKDEDVVIPDETLRYIIGNETLCNGEQGVRNLKRCLEIIHTKLNLFRLIKSDENLFAKDIDMEVRFPFTVLKKHVDILIKNEDSVNQSMLAMYV
jgi:ATP-dependent Lon protease